MSIFLKKREVGLKDFCSNFYEKNILNPVVEGIDAGAVYFDTVRKSIVEADQNFTNINSQKFTAEMIPLRFELFALAWLHQFGDKLAVDQSVFTKIFLQENNRNDIWDKCESYNQAIARSSTIGKTTEKAFDRAYLARVNKTRMDLFSQYHNKGYDPECVARALNRLFTEKAWKNNITASLLMIPLCKSLGFDENFVPNEEARFRLVAILRGLYDGVRQSIEKIKIKG